MDFIPSFGFIGFLDTVTDTHERLSCLFFIHITILLYSCFNYVYKVPQCCTCYEISIFEVIQQDIARTEIERRTVSSTLLTADLHTLGRVQKFPA